MLQTRLTHMPMFLTNHRRRPACCQLRDSVCEDEIVVRSPQDAKPVRTYECGKVGQIKHVIPILLAIWEEGMGADPDEMMLTVSMALNASRDADEILDDHPNEPRLLPDVAEAFFQHTILYCQLITKFHNWNEMRLF